jgi:hypothetical protein
MAIALLKDHVPYSRAALDHKHWDALKETLIQ